MKRFRAALVGCGQMANTWVAYALERADTEIVAVVDLNADAAQAMLERHGLTCPAFTTLTAALAATQPNLVFDVTIPDAHEAVALEALASGCDVFSEKPLAAGMAAARRIVDAARAHGRTHAVMQNRRYLHAARALKSSLERGDIGTPGLYTADFFIGAHFGGFRDAMDSPLLLDMAIHTFDSARFFSRANAVSVHCTEFNPAGSWYTGNAAAVCTFTLSSGAVFSYRGMWCAEGFPTSWEADWRITGSLGTARWDGSSAPQLEVLTDPAQPGFTRGVARRELPSEDTAREGHAGCLDEMFTAVLEGRAPETVGSDNAHSLAMVFAALESARTGAVVSIPPVSDLG